MSGPIDAKIRIAITVICGMGVTGCQCAKFSDPAMPIRVPMGAADALVAGIPLGAFDDQVLQQIDPNDSASHLRLWIEFEQGPRMVMLHAPPGVVTAVDTFVSPFTQDQMPPLEVDNVFCGRKPDGNPWTPLPDGTYPLEEFCLATPPHQSCTQVLQVGADYGLPFSRSYIKLQRATATLTDFRLTPTDPPLANVMVLNLTVRDIQVRIKERILDANDTQWYPPPLQDGSHAINIDSLTVECELRPGGVGEVEGCGEVLVTCAPTSDFMGPHLALSGTNGFLFGVPLADYEGLLENMLVSRLTAGVRLHFEGFYANGLTINPTSMPTPFLLKLTGEVNRSACSYEPAPPPANPGPIRGITRVRALIGDGEMVAQNGDVKPYHLVPEVKVDWQAPVRVGNAWNPRSDVFLPWTRVLGFDRFGHELTKLEPDGSFILRNLDLLRLETSVELLREAGNTCWQTPVKTAELMEPITTGYLECPTCLGVEAFMRVSFGGSDSVFTREPMALGGAKYVAMVDRAEADFRDEVLPILMRELGDQICPGPNCPDQCPGGVCESWTRFELVPSGPWDPKDPIPPVRFDLWVNHRLPIPEYYHHFNPRECAPQPAGDITDRRVVDPKVTFARFQVDSAEFQSSHIETPFVDAPSQMFVSGHFGPENIAHGQNGPAATRGSVVDVEGSDSVVITLTSDCRAHGSQDPHLKDSMGAPEPCWNSQFTPPPPGTMTVTSAFSKVTPARVSLDDEIFWPGTVANMSINLGHQLSAVTGPLDRSGLRFFTAVPQIYRDIGLTTAVRDYRETSIDLLTSNPWHTPMLFDWQHGGSFPSPSDLDQHLDFGRHPRWTNVDHRGHRLKYFADWNRDFVSADWVGDEAPSFCLSNDKRRVGPRKFSFVGAGLQNEKELNAGVILPFGPTGSDGLPEISSSGGASGSFWPVLH